MKEWWALSWELYIRIVCRILEMFTSLAMQWKSAAIIYKTLNLLKDWMDFSIKQKMKFSGEIPAGGRTISTRRVFQLSTKCANFIPFFSAGATLQRFAAQKCQKL